MNWTQDVITLICLLLLELPQVGLTNDDTMMIYVISFPVAPQNSLTSEERCFWGIFVFALQIEMASGKVLEETYLKWVQYKEDCVKMIENEPLSQGTENFIR